ncbi:MAG: WXG100 family type VII secretion target [Anaerolineales bacterium]|nr:WXG100 family type VII secretion target [Anaerolineales bacterium]
MSFPFDYEIKIDPDSINDIASKMEGMADEVEKQANKIHHTTEEMRSGGWLGPDAEKYIQEYEQITDPSFKALREALQELSRTARSIAEEMQKAEEEGAQTIPDFEY